MMDSAAGQFVVDGRNDVDSKDDDQPSDEKHTARQRDAPHQRAAQVHQGLEHQRRQRKDHQTLMKLRVMPEQNACGDKKTEVDQYAERTS